MSVVVSWISLALFNVSMLSGLVVAFFYKPSFAYESVQKLTYLIPYGDFFRQLHYFSSEAFLVFVLLHIVLELLKYEIKISYKSWIYSILATVILFFLMFTGYVLKADLNGLSAGQVALSLIEQTPILRNLINFFEDNVIFVWKFYIWHILFLPILITFFIYKHIKTIKTKYLLIAFAISLICMMFFTMPKDLDIGLEGVKVTGPWFFKGAENLLVLGVSPLLVDIVICIPFLLLLLFFYLEKYRKVINISILLWVVFYAYLIYL